MRHSLQPEGSQHAFGHGAGRLPCSSDIGDTADGSISQHEQDIARNMLRRLEPGLQGAYEHVGSDADGQQIGQERDE